MSLPSFLSRISFFFKEKKKEIVSAQTPQRLKSNYYLVASQPLDNASQKQGADSECSLNLVSAYY
jgi:hypothetical protein